MFKKRQIRNIRRKQSDDEDDNNGDVRSDSESRGSNGSASLKEPKKGADVISSAGSTKSVPSTSSLLSFGDEEGKFLKNSTFSLAEI